MGMMRGRRARRSGGGRRCSGAWISCTSWRCIGTHARVCALECVERGPTPHHQLPPTTHPKTHSAHFVSFGADVIMTLLDLASQAEDEEVRRAALQRAELLGGIWSRAFPTLKLIAGKKLEGLRRATEEGGLGPPEEGWTVGRLAAGDEAVLGQLVALGGEEGGGEAGEEEEDAEVGLGFLEGGCVSWLLVWWRDDVARPIHMQTPTTHSPTRTTSTRRSAASACSRSWGSPRRAWPRR